MTEVSSELKPVRKKYDPDKVEFGRLGNVVYFRASTWAFNPKVTRSTYDREFRKNYVQAMADYASIAPQSVEAYCRDPEVVFRNANRDRVAPLDEEGRLYDWFLPGPYYYYFHGDLADSGDAAGLSMGHWDPRRKMVVMDLMLQLVPKPGQNLQFDRFRQLIVTLSDRGFVLRKITFDQWHSRDTIQYLRNRNLPADLFSVDRDTRAYDTLLDLLLSDRLDYYYHPVFDEEFRNLVRVGNKVDHKETSTKDLCDSIAAVCYHAVEENREEFSTASATIPLMAGISSDVQQYVSKDGIHIEKIPLPEAPVGELEGESVPFVVAELK